MQGNDETHYYNFYIACIGLAVTIPEGWEVHTRKNPIFGPNFFYSLLRPKKYQNRNKQKKIAQQNFERARPQIS
jgi:hypothetical protein